ncbi:MAG: hypothetical protein VXW91_09350 [Pseudomonadota bacterium]|nr:hypothetical protein [Pseudomonadota bacterium]
MAWGTRQQRLRDILGASNSLCFQVFVVVTEGVVSDKLFDELVAEHDIDFTYDDLATLPKQHIGRLSFNRGFLCQSEKFGRAAQITSVEPIYTVSPYEVDLTNLDADICFGPADFQCIRDQYIPEIEMQLPELKFEGRNYAEKDGFSIDFKYGVQPYCPSLCHPRDLGFLKPITIIGGHTIMPAVGADALNGSSKPKP